MVKGSRQVVIALFILFIPFLVHASDLGEVYLRFIAGDVQIRPVGTADWVSISANTPLLEGDQIWIPEDGRAELAFRDGTLLRLDQNSALEIVSLRKDRLQLYLDAGHAYVNRASSEKKSFILETPALSLSASRQSIFKADVSDYGDVEITVVDGQILAQRDGQGKVINAGEGFVFQKDAGEPERTALLSPDEWEQWNMERDENFCAPGPSSRYLPEELGPYAADFDQYGTWVNAPDYGYVWAPTVVGGWSPYGYGRWAWMRGDYVWIPYEPWGWIPHHYGRWIYRSTMGWGWVPPRKSLVRWAPGYVGWSHTLTSVSWVPLAPRDTYYGHGYNGPGSVNVARTGASKGQPKTLFTNARVNNAVTTITAETFAGLALPTITSGPGKSARLGQLAPSSARVFHARESRTAIHSVTGFASAPIQVGDVLVWKAGEANGVRTYLMSNLPQGPRHLNVRSAISTNPIVERDFIVPATVGPGTSEMGHAGYGPAQRIADRVAKPRGTGDIMSGSRQTGTGNVYSMTARATMSSSSSGISSRGNFRGSSSRGRR
ncbi:MAG TPA: FecR family protein [Syntrophorhabdales bacterium]|nr:FecR family protein [Syntrophorhabdales bacterium]